MRDRQRAQVQVERIASPCVDDRDQERGQETQAKRPVGDRVQEWKRQQIEGDVLPQHLVSDSGGPGVLKERETLPLGAGSTRQHERDERGHAEGGAAEGAANARSPDTDRAQARPRTEAQRYDDARDQVDERQREASDEQRRLQEQAGREDVFEPERVKPLHLGEEPHDRAGEDEDQQRQAEKSGADPETSWWARDPDLPGFEGAASLERIKRPVPAGHLLPKLRPKLERGRPR